jgi:hypothetical protein
MFFQELSWKSDRDLINAPNSSMTLILPSPPTSGRALSCILTWFTCKFLKLTCSFFHRDRSFIKLAKLKLMSISTDEEVDPLFKKTAADSLPLTSRATLKNGLASGKASSRRNDFTFNGQDETVPNNAPEFPQERKRERDRWTKAIDEIQCEVKSARKGIEDLKTNFEEELDLLAESVSAFTSRISEIDALKLEVKTLKRRLQRLEHGNSSSRVSHAVKDLTEESAIHSRLAKVAGMVERKPKTGKSAAAALLHRPTATSRADEIIESDMPDKPSARKPHSPHTSGASKLTPQSNPVNKQSLGNNDSQSSSSDMESYISPIPAARPGVTKVPTASSISDTSGVALEFEPQPTQTPSTKPRKKLASAVSLNSHTVIPSSDPEDDDYRPRTSNSAKPRRGRGLIPSRGVHRVGRPSNGGLRLPDPEWEAPDWENKPSTPWSHKRGIVRRGVSGRVLTARSEPKRRGRPRLWASPPIMDGPKRDPHGRPVNEAGIPLRPNGKPDRRFLKKTVRDAAGVLRYAAVDDDGISAQPSASHDASHKGLKRARSEGGAGVDESDPRDAKKPRGDGTEITDEDFAELDWRWGIQQQSA